MNDSEKKRFLLHRIQASVDLLALTWYHEPQPDSQGLKGWASAIRIFLNITFQTSCDNIKARLFLSAGLGEETSVSVSRAPTADSGWHGSMGAGSRESGFPQMGPGCPHISSHPSVSAAGLGHQDGRVTAQDLKIKPLLSLISLLWTSGAWHHDRSRLTPLITDYVAVIFNINLLFSHQDTAFVQIVTILFFIRSKHNSTILKADLYKYK